MNNSKFLSVTKVVMASLLLILAGCTVSSAAPTPTGEGLSAVSTIVASRIPLSTRTLPPATQTLSPMPTLTSTPNPTPTPTAQPTATETPVAIPTPSGQNDNAKVLWLLETNNGCQLPCWWGITPGQTTWDAAERFFNTFTTTILSAPTSSPNSMSYSPLIPLPSEDYIAGTTSPVYSVRNGIVDVIRTNVSIGNTSSGALSQHTLAAFLATYGAPTEVWLSTFSTPPGGGPGTGSLPFITILFYPEQGIAVLYYAPGERVEDMIHGCPQAYLVLYFPLTGM